MLAGGANQSFHHFSRPATDMARPFLLLVGLFALRAALALPIVEFTSGTKLGDLPRATLLAPKGLVRRADIALTAVEFKASGKRGGRGGRHIITTPWSGVGRSLVHVPPSPSGPHMRARRSRRPCCFCPRGVDVGSLQPPHCATTSSAQTHSCLCQNEWGVNRTLFPSS